MSELHERFLSQIQKLREAVDNVKAAAECCNEELSIWECEVYDEAEETIKLNQAMWESEVEEWRQVVSELLGVRVSSLDEARQLIFRRQAFSSYRKAAE